MSAGYSGTPLIKKLGIKEGYAVRIVNPPPNYWELLGILPSDILHNKKRDLDFVHIFTKSSSELAKLLNQYKELICRDGMIWVSWPKKSSKIPSDITEQTIRDICLPMGLVDIKVCAVDEQWSGLKLVWRKELRI